MKYDQVNDDDKDNNDSESINKNSSEEKDNNNLESSNKNSSEEKVRSVIRMNGNQDDFRNGIEWFREKIGWNYNQISIRSGISVANIKRVLSGEGDVSMLFVTRVIGAMWEKGIANYIFMPKMRRCIDQEVSYFTPAICSITDYAALVILLRNHFEYGNEYGSTEALCTVFRALEHAVTMLGDSHSWTSFSLSPEGRYEAELKYVDQKHDIRYDKTSNYEIDQRITTARLTSYFQHSYWSPSIRPDSNPYDNLNSSDYRPLMENGETTVWSDIPNILISYRKQYNYSIKNMQRSSVILRMENLKNHAYKYDDVIGIDNELEMGGAFFSVCYNATRNSVLLGNLLYRLGPDDWFNSPEDFELGIRSFFTMLRYLETREHQEVNHYRMNCAAAVLEVLRKVFYYNCDQTLHYKKLEEFTNIYPAYFPKNPLYSYDPEIAEAYEYDEEMTDGDNQSV